MVFRGGETSAVATRNGGTNTLRAFWKTFGQPFRAAHRASWHKHLAVSATGCRSSQPDGRENTLNARKDYNKALREARQHQINSDIAPGTSAPEF